MFVLQDERRSVACLEFRKLLDMGDLFHIWGEAGAGKTLLACAIAAEANKDGHVRWVCTDGKRSFVRTLRTNLMTLDDYNITVNVPTGHKEVQEAILSLPKSIPPDTSLIVVDPITRVLDMSRQDYVMWGRELIEAALPSLVALNQKGVKVVLVSEVRCLEHQAVPVMHESISVWKPVDLHVVRSPGRDSTILVWSGQTKNSDSR
jgi:predicted ATP-dependent serine protease